MKIIEISQMEIVRFTTFDVTQFFPFPCCAATGLAPHRMSTSRAKLQEYMEPAVSPMQQGQHKPLSQRYEALSLAINSEVRALTNYSCVQ
jgi:hypothetical protein